MGSKIIWQDKTLVNQLKTFDARMDRGITAAVGYHAAQGEAYAKRNAPWRDRTSNARNGLFGTAQRDRPHYRVIIGHSVPYGVWLEVRWNGRYQIIRPTIDHVGPELMTTISHLYGKIFGGVR